MSGRHRKPRSQAAGRHRRPPGPAHWLAPGLVVLALLGAGGVGAHVALTNSDKGTHAQVTPGVPKVVTTPTVTLTPTPTPSATPSAATTPPAAHRPAVALRMVITGSVSWIEVRRPSGHVLVSGLVRHGHRLTYAHGPLEVVIGNAAAVQLTRHHHTQRAGRPGEVVTFTVR